MFLFLSAPVFAQTDQQPRTNLAIIRDLAERIGRRVGHSLEAVGGDTTSVSVHPPENAWYVQPSLINGLSGSTEILINSDRVGVSAELAITSIQVSYTDPRSDGILGATILDRSVSVIISALVVDRRSGIIHMNEDLAEMETDTVELADIEALENPNIAVTEGSLPAEGFFSNLAGPLILIAAIGVAVFLLFSVRS